MTISFTDFWPDFQPESNFFTDLLKSINDKIQIIPFSNDTDILIYSCFGNQHQQTNRQKTKKVFYTGESIRPNFDECDYSWTFDFDTYNNKNIRIPLWLTQIDFFKKENYKNPQYVIPLEYVTQQNINPWFNKSRDKFCVIVNNHLPNQRATVVNSLAKKKEVHGFGHAFGSTWFYGEGNKINKISDYRFNICFENKLYPGYYTEKPIHAKVAGCIPLYYADKDINKDFNSNCFINLSDFNSVEEYTEYILKVENTPSLFNEIKNQSLFNTPNFPLEFLDDIKNKITKTLF